jgi:hypothetical protein
LVEVVGEAIDTATDVRWTRTELPMYITACATPRGGSPPSDIIRCCGYTSSSPWNMAFLQIALYADQFGRLESDVSAGGWTASTGATLSGTVNEVPPDDTDYITSHDATAAVLALGPLDQPIAGTVTIRVRAKHA